MRFAGQVNLNGILNEQRIIFHFAICISVGEVSVDVDSCYYRYCILLQTLMFYF